GRLVSVLLAGPMDHAARLWYRYSTDSASEEGGAMTTANLVSTASRAPMIDDEGSISYGQLLTAVVLRR
ncbi:MAG: hypothetical protein V7643_2259, partial [Mycobacterium sp.]